MYPKFKYNEDPNERTRIFMCMIVCLIVAFLLLCVMGNLYAKVLKKYLYKSTTGRLLTIETETIPEHWEFSGRRSVRKIKQYDVYHPIYEYEVNDINYTVKGLRYENSTDIPKTVTIYYMISNHKNAEIGDHFPVYMVGIYLVICLINNIIIISKMTPPKKSTPFRAMKRRTGYVFVPTQKNVLKVINVDEDKKRIYFLDWYGRLYFYETDSIEEMKDAEGYKIELSRDRCQKTKIEFQRKLQKAIQIVNVQPSDFVKMQ